MASAKFGMFLTEMAGKTGGTVTQRGRFGQSVLNSSKPPRTTSPLQNGVRGVFAQMSSSWRGLSEADRDEWRALALLVTRVSRLGVVYTPSGYQLYVECAVNQSLVGAGVPVTCPPVPPVLPVFTAFSVFFVESNVMGTVTWTYVSGGAEWMLLFYPIAAGNGSRQSYPFSPYLTFSGSDVTLATATWDTRRPMRVQANRQAGNIFQFAYRFVSNVSGFSTPLVRGETSIVP